ncbi:MAG TPA: ATP-binding protein [Chitinophagaceae bacterium]|nr:ATP-binding protein [Chitinophagaceae bacterium]
MLDQPDLETSVVNLFEEDSELIFSWNASRVPGSSEKIISSITSFPKNSSELTREMMSLYHSGEKEYTLEAAGFKLMEFLKVLIKANPRVADYIGDNPPEKVFYHFTTFTGGNLLTVSYQPPAEETKSLQRRAASVFDMAYRRYLDLKKAEAQTREAQTEVALERIRARAMAMHSSYELMDVAHILREQMGMLDQPDLETSVINLFDEDSDYIHSWHAFREPGSSSGKSINGTVSFRKDSSALTREMIDHYHSGEKEYTLEATGEKLNEFIQVLTNSEPEISNYIGKNPPGRVYYHFATFAGGALLTVSYQPTNEDVKLLQRRAASVFELAYRRYLDLKKAEAQTREAQIEVAVERVRAKALAMHKSEDLHSVVVTLKKELMSLQIPEITAATIYLAQDDASIRILDLSDTGGDNDDDQPQLKLDKIFRLEDTDPDLWIRRMWDRNENYFVLEADEDDFVRVVQWIRTVDPAGAEVAEKIIREKSIKKAWLPTVKLGKGIMNIDLLAPPAPEIESILLKMGAGFDLAYKRFLDLQNAEAQAREAQIEAAVEKVRSRSLAMHKSDELQEVVHTVFERLKELNVDFYTAIIILFKEGSKDIIWWLESKANQQYSRILVPFTPVPYFIDLFETRESGGDLFSKCYSFVEKNELFNHLFQNTDFKYVPEKQKHFLQATEFATMSVALAKNTGIHITSYSKKSFSDQDNQIVSKFANVFDQAYTRFLDLQKAEAQAREAQIEAALERVRAKVMAMSNSNDLNETSLVFGEQLRKLGIDWQFAYFWLVDESKNENTFWITWPDSKTSFTTYTLAEAETYFNDCLISWRAGVKIHDNYVPPEGVKQWIDTFQRIADDAGGEAKRIMVPQTFADGVYYYDAMMKYGSFGICISKPATDEEKKIQCRFAIEFERAYTRFLDLKQAEAQAREAKIEAALERVRARAMAMHKSDDLKMAVATVFEELDKLNIGILRCGIAIMDKDKPRADVWITVKSEQTNTIQVSGDESLDYHPLLRGAYDGWVRQEDFSYVLQGEDLLSYYRDVASIKYQLPVSSPFDKEKVDQQQYYFNAVFQDGSLFAFMEAAITDEAKTVMKRFANVFNLTYKRFLDLQKAEAQAREAQIELGLERVRARAMAMQKSGELKELIATVSTELSKLDVILDRCFLMIYDFKTLGVTWWMANPETSSDPIGLYVKYHEQAPYLAFLKAWQDRLVKWQYLLEGSAKKTWDEFLFVETELSRLPGFVIDNMRANDKVYLSASFNNFGCLTLATLEPLSDEQFDIMLRFAKVFDLTYTRFNDLKQAEAQARAAKIEAALERVRARALAMQEPEELKDVAQVLRTEMGLLGVEELETCSIYINDESAEKAECWYALKDIRSGEKKLVNDHFALNLSETWVGREMLQFYQSPQKQISIIMQGENRKEWIHYCEEHSAPLRGYYGEVIPDRTYHLYKFSHGAIGAAAAGDISEESWRMLGRAASVFSLAYSRFKDLTQARIDLIKLKEEKKRAEEALTELQATQKQLIQSEKMASLGELTAGIAHEIQNPLNFVNNFSDVSNELLEEMKQELATGNTQQAIEIVNGVKENLEKILHHGKRADAIVKGMLQHSRASSGQKELIDINMLAEEYLRLAYHGLRAKDKFFNAKFETDLDPSLHKINVVPQEIGRVILNLINNAFYAVTEKKKSLPSLPKGGQEKSSNDYEPIVTVRTRRHGPPPAGGDRGSVEIRVVDNGYGIPQKVLDKIFQPFFTTKPTGQGTGLGLSLSYDIITKGHQGEIKVNTKENEGTEFTIILPE